MISKAPALGKKKPETWIREFLGWVEGGLRFEFLRVGGIWFPVQGTEQHGGHPCDNIAAASSAYIGVVVPRETQEIREAVIRIIPTVTGTIDWTATATYGGKDEDESAETATMTADTLAVTDDAITEIDVTDLFADAESDDQVGIQFTLDAAATTTDVNVLGLYLKTR